MKTLLFLLSLLATAYGYHILCIQGVPSVSHFNLMYAIVKPLLRDGHKITFVTTHPDRVNPDKNLQLIDTSFLQDLYKNINTTETRRLDMAGVKEFSRNVSRGVIECPEVRTALTQNNYDAVVTEWFFSDVEAGYAAVQQAPWILLSGIVMHTHMEYLIDTVRSIPVIPLWNKYTIPMSFRERVLTTVSFLQNVFDTWMDESLAITNYESFFKPIAQSRGVTLPSYSKAIHNISVMFVNSHPSFTPAQSLPPNVVEIAGFHIDEEVPPLPKELQDLLDSSPQGVIYFSLGSVFKAKSLSEVNRKNLVKLFRGLPYTVLWKFDGEVENKPKNLHIRSWMPQSSILAHPNTKIFITHCGLLSVLESLKFGVPILAVPVFGDQPSNAARAVAAGHAVRMAPSADMAGDMARALAELISNDSYTKKAKELSRLFLNRPVSTAKQIQYYVKLAIESKGAYHLRSKTHQYEWYQYWMVDQLAAFIVLLYLVYAILKIVLRSLRNLLLGKKKIKKQ